MSTLPRSRVQDLIKLQSTLYKTTYNPHRLRTGNSVLRQRLLGPTLASYYLPRVATIREFKRMFPRMETYDPQEVDRLEGLTIAKSKGKGAPRKRRTKEEGKGKKRR